MYVSRTPALRNARSDCSIHCVCNERVFCVKTAALYRLHGEGGREGGREAGRQAGRQAGREGGRQAGREGGMEGVMG